MFNLSNVLKMVGQLYIYIYIYIYRHIVMPVSLNFSYILEEKFEILSTPYRWSLIHHPKTTV